MIADFDKIIGLAFLKGWHINDSKRELNSHVDRHDNLGKGVLGMEVFSALMNDPRFDNMPMILETPDESLWPEEIKLLYSLNPQSVLL
jgi:deoxyribonuclease-4